MEKLISVKLNGPEIFLPFVGGMVANFIVKQLPRLSIRSWPMAKITKKIWRRVKEEGNIFLV